MKKNYAAENNRPVLAHRPQTEPSPVIQARPNVHGHQNVQYVPDMQPPPQRRVNRSPERQVVPVLPPPPQRRVNHSPEGREYRPAVRRSATISEPVPPPRVERSPEQNGPLVDARGRRYEPIRLEPVQALPEPVRGRPQHSIRSEQSPASQPQPSQERTAQQQQVIDSVRERLNQVINSEVPPQQQQQQPQQQSVQRSANRSAERKPEPQPQPQRNTSNPVQTANGHVYQMVAPSQPPTRGSAVTGGNPQPQPQPQPQVQQVPVAQPQPEPQPKQQPQPEQRLPSTNTSATTEHPTRFGVEIVRGRSLNNSQTSSQPQKSPVTVENLEQNALAIMPFEEPVQQAPVVKQLRFETPIKSISRRYSDLSLAGSMMVQVGDTPSRLESEYGESEESESDDDSYDEGSESGEEDDDASWEDDDFAEAEEVANKSKVVRFADKPLPSPKALPLVPRNVHSIFEKAALLRKGFEIERPNSRQGRRVEISRPLSRSGQRFPRHSLATPPRKL